MGPVRVDLFQQLLNLQFVKRFGKVTLDAGQRERLGGIAIHAAFGCEKAKEDLQCDHDEFNR